MILALMLAAANPAAHPSKAADVEAQAGAAGEAAAGRLWTIAGNQRLAEGDSAAAAADFDKALSTRGLTVTERGEALLDRARAAHSAGDLATADARAADAARLVPQDPFIWYFRTVVAVARGDVPKAKLAIARALALAPNDPTVLFESGHVAKLAGEDAAARTAWTKAMQVDPTGPTGRSAREALALEVIPLTVQSTDKR